VVLGVWRFFWRGTSVGFLHISFPFCPFFTGDLELWLKVLESIHRLAMLLRDLLLKKFSDGMEIPHFLSIFSLLPPKSCEYPSQAAINQHSVSLLLCSMYFSPSKKLWPLCKGHCHPNVISLQTVNAKMILSYTSTKE